MSEYFVDQFSNGIRLVTVPMPHLHSVELVCYVAVGGRYETAEQSGLSHFLEHMIFRGTEEYATSTDLERAFEAIGGSVNASTDAETTCFHSRVHPDYLDRGIALFASMLRRPKFNDIDTERRIVLEEAREDYNEEGVQINPDNLMAAMLWPDHPLGRSLIGSPQTLSAIDDAQLRSYYSGWYQPSNLVICACGAVDRAMARQVVSEHFDDWQPAAIGKYQAAPEALEQGPQTCWVHDSDSQVTVQMAFPLPGRNDVSTQALRLLRRIMSWGGGARLTLRLREELGLTYAVEANVAMLSDSGYLAIDIAVAPENLIRAVDELLAVLADLCNQPVSEEEVEAVVKSYAFDLEYTRDQSESLAVRYGWGTQAGYLRTLEQDISELRQLRPSDVQAVAQRFFKAAALKLVVVGPWSDEQRIRVEELLNQCTLG